MNKVYVVFECDNHRSHDSYCIKLLSGSLIEAMKIYNKDKKEYRTNDWFYNLALYKPTGKECFTGNVLRDLEIIKTTER